MSRSSVALEGPGRHSDDALQTRFPFELPRGLVDDAGQLHRDGVMRLATARDEILPMRDARVRDNEAYLTVLVLARVVVRIGSIVDVTAGVIESLFASDLAFLQDLYRRVNQEGHAQVSATCPECDHGFSVDLVGDAAGELA